MSLALLPDSEPLTQAEAALTSNIPPKFPHTRAQLAAFARQHKPSDSYDSDAEALDDLGRVSSSFVNKVVSLLGDEREDELKALLKETYGFDDQSVEQSVLDLMHKHRDDVSGVPFLFLTPTRRPISRPSSRASTHSARLPLPRPETPNSAPGSPLAQVFRRPPLTSPLAGGSATSYMSARSDYSASPSSSPVLSHAHVAATQAYAQFTASLPASPLSSPRLLNAKASEFKPIQRPLSAASSNPGPPRHDTPSPDLWAHSPFRATSNLAIAAPLLPDQPGLTRSLTPNTSLRSPLRSDIMDSDEEEPLEPFGPKPLQNFHTISGTDFDTQWSNSSNSNTSLSPDDIQYLDNYPSLNPHANPFDFDTDYSFPFDDDPTQNGASPDDDNEENATLTDGMTPFDVLSSVFGSTLAPSELEDALAANGYDFERSMQWLIERALPQPAPQNAQVKMQHVGGRVTVVSRDIRGGARGGYQSTGRPAPRYVNGRPVPGGNRVCRYFVAGECLRADCRFSHDLERALCRFWLRGTCAKGEHCEFLHHLPKDVDISSLSNAMARANINIQGAPMPSHNPALDDFPVLGMENDTNGKAKRNAYNDPARTRFAAAVKKSATPQSTLGLTSMSASNNVDSAARREVMGRNAVEDLHHRSAIVAPRPSPRLRLRPPTLLPTLTTGEAVNKLYMSYRSRALQLGAARNACLSRAADAWRRGDGAAAKRFSREGHDLNAKMGVEMASAASQLVRERSRLAEQAVKNRDLSWSDDPGDRTTRGKPCGAGLGVTLGIASSSVGDKLKSEERTEVMLDLHGLHANEATEVLEEFLLALEQEYFFGLAYAIVGEQKHTGTQDAARGASRARLATGVREWIHRWGYPWSERDGIICVDPLTHASE
ncbi:zinc finger ccch type domain containing protein [Moniliophthora roreri MCA 2997]|uniref:Zinc finger ccch type domain containing protein n=2 Tax=Moniliophthora roreri TaxID=221103 RepID=V2XVE8_MONRO|nr:zinc finger ccch type domain containing protein [Moniliophthora roreri MCA 2997]KAI3600498.1 zinc finger ccch type domain containing protein [Moniliophthora roreri]